MSLDFIPVRISPSSTGTTGVRSDNASLAGATTQTSPVPEPVSQPPSRKTLDDAVSRLRSDVQSLHRNLEFSVDEESGIPIVKVIATDSGEVIRQIPSEVAVKLAESFKESSRLLLSEKA